MNLDELDYAVEKIHRLELYINKELMNYLEKKEYDESRKYISEMFDALDKIGALVYEKSLRKRGM